MEIIPQLISRYSIVLYAVCGLACAYFLFTGVASLRELKRAVFRLERNAVVTRAVSSLLKAMGCLLIGGAVFAVTSLAPAPAANSPLSAATATPDGIVIPTSVPTAAITSGQALIDANAVFTPTIVFLDASGAVSAAAETTPSQATPQATPAEQPTAPPATVAPAPLPEMLADCANPNAQISNPGQSEHILGAYSVRGVAVLPAGGWYKLEIFTPATGQWAFLVRGDGSVNGGALMDNFNAALFAPGEYALSLTLVSADGNVQGICRIPVVLGQ